MPVFQLLPTFMEFLMDLKRFYRKNWNMTVSVSSRLKVFQNTLFKYVGVLRWNGGGKKNRVVDCI